MQALELLHHAAKTRPPKDLGDFNAQREEEYRLGTELMTGKTKKKKPPRVAINARPAILTHSGASSEKGKARRGQGLRDRARKP